MLLLFKVQDHCAAWSYEITSLRWSPGLQQHYGRARLPVHSGMARSPACSGPVIPWLCKCSYFIFYEYAGAIHRQGTARNTMTDHAVQNASTRAQHVFFS
ncbi:hypothetical protein AMTRI_Chr06g175910 [Amborella trichopoda]